MIGLLGTILGFATSFIASWAIGYKFELPFQFNAGWMISAVVIAIGGSLFGALYPAWRASMIDPVTVMVNE